jgi:hypothetical protein
MKPGGAPTPFHSASQLDPKLLSAALEARRSGSGVFVVELPYGEPEKDTYGNFVFRSLTMEEFEAFAHLATMGDMTENVLQNTIVWPAVEDWDDHPIHQVMPGAYEELATFLVDASGYENQDGIKEARNAGRAAANNVFSAAHMFICRAFPGLTPADCRKMEIVDLFKHVAMAEQMLSSPEEPMQFPLAELLGERQVRRTSSLPDFEKLPVLTKAEVDMMKRNNRQELTAEVSRRQAEVRSNPQAAAAQREAAIREKRQRLAMERAEQDESRSLAREYGR